MSDREDQIRAALAQLDPHNDADWTAGGAPAMKAVEAILGDAKITRADVAKALPGFGRSHALGQHGGDQPVDQGAAETAYQRAMSIVAMFNVHLGRGARFSIPDAAWLLAHPDAGDDEFWAAHCANDPGARDYPYAMLPPIDKARIGVFMAAAAGSA